jgi:hypothetical protein
MQMHDAVRPLGRGDHSTPMALTVAGLALAAAAGAGWIAPPLALVPLAVLLGWSHLSSI